jgi:hypothetical protein
MRRHFATGPGLSLVLASLLATLLAAPVAAMPRGTDGAAAPTLELVVDGTNCGQVTAFLAPTAVTDGSINLDGATETIEAGTTLGAATALALTALATADAFTCLDLAVDGGGDITAISIAASATICGSVSTDGTLYTIDDTTFAGDVADLIADGDLTALLDAAIAASADVCADLTVQTTSGVVTAVGVDATFELCGTVTVDGGGDATVDGATLPASFLSPGTTSTLELAAAAGAQACVTIAADSSGNVDATVTVEICATVDAVGGSSMSVDGVVIPLASGASVDVETGADFGLRFVVTEDGVASAVNVSVAGCADASGGSAGGNDPGDSGGPEENVGGVEGVPDPDATLPPTSTASERASSMIGTSPAIALTVLVLLSAGLVGMRLAFVRRWN